MKRIYIVSLKATLLWSVVFVFYMQLNFLVWKGDWSRASEHLIQIHSLRIKGNNKVDQCCSLWKDGCCEIRTELTGPVDKWKYEINSCNYVGPCTILQSKQNLPIMSSPIHGKSLASSFMRLRNSSQGF